MTPRVVETDHAKPLGKNEVSPNGTAHRRKKRGPLGLGAPPHTQTREKKGSKSRVTRARVPLKASISTCLQDFALPRLGRVRSYSQPHTPFLWKSQNVLAKNVRFSNFTWSSFANSTEEFETRQWGPASMFRNCSICSVIVTCIAMNYCSV